MRFFTQQINPRSFGSRCLKGAEESTPRVDSSVPLIHHDPRDLGLICLVKKRKIIVHEKHMAKSFASKQINNTHDHSLRNNYRP